MNIYDTIIYAAAMLFAVVAFIDRWWLGKAVDKVIKRDSLTAAFVSLEDYKTFQAFGKWMATSFLAVSNKAVSGNGYGFIRYAILVAFTSTICLGSSHFLNLHYNFLTLFVKGVHHTATSAETEFMLVNRVNMFALSKGTTAEVLLKKHTIGEVIRLLPPQEPQLDRAKYHEWRRTPYAISKYGSLQIERGVATMKWIGAIAGIVFSYISWNISRTLARRITQTTRGLQIVGFWALDILSTSLLTFMAVSITIGVLSVSGEAGLELSFVSDVAVFFVSGFVFLSTATHFLIGAVGVTVALFEEMRFLLARAVHNIEQSSNSAISSIILLLVALLSAGKLLHEIAKH